MRKGDIVICKAMHFSKITFLKKYTIVNILLTSNYDKFETYLDIINDEGILDNYNQDMFITLEEFRNNKISEILLE